MISSAISGSARPSIIDAGSAVWYGVFGQWGLPETALPGLMTPTRTRSKRFGGGWLQERQFRDPKRCASLPVSSARRTARLCDYVSGLIIAKWLARLHMARLPESPRDDSRCGTRQELMCRLSRTGGGPHSGTGTDFASEADARQVPARKRSRRRERCMQRVRENRSHREAETLSDPTRECSGVSNRAMTPCRGVA